MQTLSATSQLGKRTRLYRRRRNDQENQTTQRSRIATTHAFLNQTFVTVSDQALHGKTNLAIIEDAFYRNLQNLAATFHFSPKKTRHLGYPENINAAFENAEQHMNKKCPAATLIISESGDGSIGLSLVHEFDTGMTLFYVPMDVLMLLHKSKKSAAFWLLISCYAYLHQCAGMPLCGAYSYVDDCYRMNEDAMIDMTDGYGNNEHDEELWDLSRMKRCTKILNPLLKDRKQLEVWEERIRTFKPTSKQDMCILKSAKQLLRIYKKFPTRSFRENTSAELIHEGDDQKGYIEMYFSFCWTVNGWMIEQLVEYANCDLREVESFDQPVAIQTYNRKLGAKKPGFQFEKRLVAAMNDLVYNVNILL